MMNRLIALLLLSLIPFIAKAESTYRFQPKKLDLGQLFRQYGSDKDINGYSSVYHTLFTPLRDQPILMLEIGIGTMIPEVHSSMVGYARPGYKPGGSLRAWRDFFRNGEIFGVDVQPDTQFNDEPRITTNICDSTNGAAVKEYMSRLGDLQFDIIIDDGSHADTSQLKTLEHFYPYLKKNGIYIIEDVYPGSSVTTNPKQVAQIVGGDPFFYVGVSNNICVIYKNKLVRETDTYQY